MNLPGLVRDGFIGALQQRNGQTFLRATLQLRGKGLVFMCRWSSSDFALDKIDSFYTTIFGTYMTTTNYNRFVLIGPFRPF